MKIAKVIARAGMIAALYTGLTYAFAFSSFATWTVQFRISEVLTILPLFWGEAVVGLWVGCLLGNLISAPLDIAFGSSATLIASLLTFLIGRLLRRGNLRVILGAIPPVVVNALVVPLTFTVFADAPMAYPLQALFVFIGQLAVLAAGRAGGGRSPAGAVRDRAAAEVPRGEKDARRRVERRRPRERERLKARQTTIAKVPARRDLVLCLPRAPRGCVFVEFCGGAWYNNCAGGIFARQGR